MRGMNHSLKLLTDHILEDFMIKEPLPGLGLRAIEQARVSPLQDRPLLTMDTQLLNTCNVCLFYFLLDGKPTMNQPQSVLCITRFHLFLNIYIYIYIYNEKQ